MGIMSLFRGRDAPKNSTAGSSYSFFMGNSSAGKNVNERSAMQMTAVYACVRILSEAILFLLFLYNTNRPLGVFTIVEVKEDELPVDISKKFDIRGLILL